MAPAGSPPRLAPSGRACGGAGIATGVMPIQRNTIMAKQQSRKPAKDANQIGASEVNSALSITNDERPEKTALQPKARSKGADTAPVSISSPDLPRAGTKRAMLIGMLERAQGASVAEIGQRLGWLPHTVRAAITG